MMSREMRIDEYLTRIREHAPAEANADALGRLHRAHRETFLFENLTIQAGGRISLALCDLERKFLDQGRGGYCFEHNTLFAAALRELGIAADTLLGRVRRGFGALGLVEPMPLADGASSPQGGLVYRLRRDGCHWILSARDASADVDLYEFTDDPQTMWDVEVANHFTSTHPESIFRKSLTIQRSAGAERVILRSDTLSRYRDGRLTEEPVARDRMADVARREFGVDLPPGPFVFEASG